MNCYSDNLSSLNIKAYKINKVVNNAINIKTIKELFPVHPLEPTLEIFSFLRSV